MLYRVLDLGTKTAGAIDEFRAQGHIYFGDAVKTIKPKDCLGVDIREKYRKNVEAKGYDFKVIDVASAAGLAQLPSADYILLWDFLEHLASVQASDAVLRFALDMAPRALWLRMPSFEQDALTGEGRLRQVGLRFAWTHWVGHKAHYTLEAAQNCVALANASTDRRIPEWQIKIKPGRLIHSTLDRCVVPIGAPIDTVVYAPKLGPKPRVEFSPAVIGQHEVIITPRGKKWAD